MDRRHFIQRGNRRDCDWSSRPARPRPLAQESKSVTFKVQRFHLHYVRRWPRGCAARAEGCN
jgi:hypothetical protein